RFDLAHVDPSESNFDAMGKGVGEGKVPDAPSSKYLSKGLTRSRTDNLVVMRGASVPSGGGGSASDALGASSPSPLVGEGRGGGSRVTSLSSSRASDATEGAVALKQEAQHDLSPTE